MNCVEYFFVFFLMSGDTDFCSIELDGGAVVLRIDLGSGEASVQSPPGVVFNDLNWHKVSANENPPTDSTAALDFFCYQATHIFVELESFNSY